MRRRPNVALRVAASLLGVLLTLSIALGAVGLVADPRLVVALLPVTATRVTGTIYGQDLAMLKTGQTTPKPLAGAHIVCGDTHATADAQGRYAIALLRGRPYTCSISAPLYTTTEVTLSPHFQSAFRLDLGPSVTSTSSVPSSTPSSKNGGALTTAQSLVGAGCAVAGAGEVCPALALASGVLSGQLTNSHDYAPIPHAPVYCWADDSAARVSAEPPARYTADTDAQGRYILRDTPPGPYLCVANQQGAPQRVMVAPAATTTANFVECATRCSGLSYHGGPVMHAFTAYVIFWSPPGASFEPGGDNTRFQSLVRQYLSDVGGTRFYGLLTQYWDQQGPVRNVATLGGTYLDQNPYPHAGTRADPLSDVDVTNEISRVRQLKGWKVTPDAAFIVLTGYNIQECAKFSDGSACSFPDSSGHGFCAYHSFTPYYGTGDGPNYLPYLYVANNANCAYLPTFASAGAPYGDQKADAVINSLSHEQFETVTDPETRGWYDGDPSGGEIGDKCETNFGWTRWDGSTVTLNNGHAYVLQEEYSDRAGGCAYQ